MYKIVKIIDNEKYFTDLDFSNQEERYCFNQWCQACDNIGNNYNSECQLFENGIVISIYRHSDIVPFPEGREVLVHSGMTGRKGESGIIKEVLPADDGYPLQYRIAFPEFNHDELVAQIEIHGSEFIQDQNNIKNLKSYTLVEEFWLHGDLWSSEPRLKYNEIFYYS